MRILNRRLEAAFLASSIILVIFWQYVGYYELQAQETSDEQDEQEVNSQHLYRELQAAPVRAHHSWVGPAEPVSTACPKGRYRGQNPGLGLMLDTFQHETSLGCIPCPRGKYGSVAGLTSATCSGECPKGRFGHMPGAINAEECAQCPPGTYGAEAGLVTPACSGSCPKGKYSDQWGLTEKARCEHCKVEYRGWQCRNLWKTISVDDDSED
eukprot:CAMPEP_0113934972 /NCGR_PEP_ID=MMETSP1339-20121228/2223_1 /TAXON_ID=94617 /ORGANISM="Fibrocapsa japonica" /LENGTH=210 /DNA_ID=CAMNT_0000936977 /DNA_START=73 /DNA_END=705 /DNA_ORIENTATION=+ /assembly_acc=CAM_ASM_000762